MFWGAIRNHEKVALVETDITMNSETYQRILNDNLLPYLETEHMGFAFQQDNTSVHVSKSTRNFFERHEISVPSWPTRSPALRQSKMFGVLLC